MNSPYGNVEQYFRTSFLKLLHELKIEEPSRLKESGIGISIHSIRVSILAYLGLSDQNRISFETTCVHGLGDF